MSSPAIYLSITPVVSGSNGQYLGGVSTVRIEGFGVPHKVMAVGEIVNSYELAYQAALAKAQQLGAGAS